MQDFSDWRRFSRLRWGLFLGALLLLLAAVPAHAHHPFGGQVPNSAVTGFLSGLGHPVIGIDHLIFVIATGLLGAQCRRGYGIPVAFVMTTLAGTNLHLSGQNLPLSELVIAASVLGAGFFLAQASSPRPVILVGLGAIAGLFHGYAYGEAIIGAEMAPLTAYLAGFTAIQLAIALSAFGLAHRITQAGSQPPKSQPLRWAGFTIVGAGLALLSTTVLG